MDELRHRPWGIIFSSDMLLSKAKVAPDLRKVWKSSPDWGMERDLRTNLSACLT